MFPRHFCRRRPTAARESASGRCAPSASVQNAGKPSAFHGEYPLARSPSSVLLPPTGRKTDLNKLAPPESRRLAERTRCFEVVQSRGSWCGARRGPQTVDSGTGLDSQIERAKRCVFSRAGGGWKPGFWHTRWDCCENDSFPIHGPNLAGSVPNPSPIGAGAVRASGAVPPRVPGSSKRPRLS